PWRLPPAPAPDGTARPQPARSGSRFQPARQARRAAGRRRPPPFAAVQIVLRLRGLPLSRFLVGGSDLDLGPLVVGPNGATRERADDEKGECAPPHRASSAAPRARPDLARPHHSRKRSRYRYTTGVV